MYEPFCVYEPFLKRDNVFHTMDLTIYGVSFDKGFTIVNDFMWHFFSHFVPETQILTSFKIYDPSCEPIHRGKVCASSRPSMGVFLGTLMFFRAMAEPCWKSCDWIETRFKES